MSYATALGIITWRKQAFEIDPDEGYNLMKVLLVERGFALYREIWSDQPPAFTYLGVLSRAIFGETAESVRLVTVLLAAGIVFALADLLRREFEGSAGLFAGVCCALLLPQAARFDGYSRAAMIGLPCIAFATLSLWALAISRLRARVLLVAGALFGLSLLTKLMTLFLLPIWVVYLVWLTFRSEASRAFRPIARACLLFGAGLVIVASAGFAWVFANGGIEQLVESHGRALGFGGPSSAALLEVLARDAWLYVPAVIGLVVAIRRRSGIGVVLGAWMFSAAAVLSTHTPLWRHHALLVSVPAAGLAGFVAAVSFETLARKLPRAVGIGAAFGVVAALAILMAWGLTGSEPSAARRARYEQEAEVERAVRRHAPRAQLAVTSRQMYAVRLGLPVPPELAVTSSKRFRSGSLSAERVRTTLRRTRPEVVILDRRWPASIRGTVEAALGREYRMVYSGPRAHDVKVYVRSGSHVMGRE